MSDETDNFNGVEILRSVMPNWLADGKGIRGNAEVLASGAAEMSWPRASIEGGDNNEQVPDASLSGGGGAPEQKSNLAFQLIDASDENGTKLRVVAGTINGQFPPGMSTGDNPPYVLPVSGNGVVYVSVTIDSEGGITSRSIAIGSSVPVNSKSQFYFNVGSYSVSSGAVNVVTSKGGNIQFFTCRKPYTDPKEYDGVFQQ